ncbi:uncharacterized protein [Physcomitrium patens]|uniref:uncharacterized protein n=1 Tax=Physcomitrium patens TaxID=3218 RepID=UPI003CCE04B5
MNTEFAVEARSYPVEGPPMALLRFETHALRSSGMHGALINPPCPTMIDAKCYTRASVMEDVGTTLALPGISRGKSSKIRERWHCENEIWERKKKKKKKKKRTSKRCNCNCQILMLIKDSKSYNSYEEWWHRSPALNGRHKPPTSRAT